MRHNARYEDADHICCIWYQILGNTLIAISKLTHLGPRPSLKKIYASRPAFKKYAAVGTSFSHSLLSSFRIPSPVQGKTLLDRPFKGPGSDRLVDPVAWRPSVGSVSSAVLSTLLGNLCLGCKEKVTCRLIPCEVGRAFILHGCA